MEKKHYRFLLYFFVMLLVIINYPIADRLLRNFLLERQQVFVEEVIDGDTIEADGMRIRLLGINSPERGEPFYEEAKSFLEKEILNKSVEIQLGIERKDKYGRVLAYVFYHGKNLNLELVKRGLANPYFPSGQDPSYGDFVRAWEECLSSNFNLCERSSNICSNCILLKNINYDEQEAVLYNECNFDCELTGWQIKDEGRKKFFFPKFVLSAKSSVRIVVGNGENNEGTLFWNGEKYVWTKGGDSFFLRDDKGKLVLWKNLRTQT